MERRGLTFWPHKLSGILEIIANPHSMPDTKPRYFK